ncbi:MAG: hypothetical protein M1817_003348 [Caeruleum heppii]|nr:MAG: hypothetical protein M1817_003348 [Caeruleum heppii]
MRPSLCLLALLPSALAAVLRRQGAATSGGGQQAIPDTCKPPGTFSNGAPEFTRLPDDTGEVPPSVYGARDVDLPFGRLFQGSLSFYRTLNDPSRNTAVWGSEHDAADQSACGIPANAFKGSGVAIHPYFLKYAGLERYCMQDVCISFWREDGSADMMLKVTDICGSESADGVPLATPNDLKIDRGKTDPIFNLKGNLPQGDTYPEKVWWFFTKCWADGLAQPAYTNNGNWFTEPHLPNNLAWSQQTGTLQYNNNQAAYPANGWPTYPNGAYNTTRVAPPIDDWVPGQEPSWSPIAGGKSQSLGDTGAAEPAPPVEAVESSSSTTPPAASTSSSEEAPVADVTDAPTQETPEPSTDTSNTVDSTVPPQETQDPSMTTTSTTDTASASSSSTTVSSDESYSSAASTVEPGTPTSESGLGANVSQETPALELPSDSEASQEAGDDECEA